MMSNTIGEKYSLSNNNVNERLRDTIDYSLKSDYKDVINTIDKNYNNIKEILNKF